MKWVLIAGKLATAFAWLMMFYNLVTPFEGNIAAILNILLAVTVVYALLPNHYISHPVTINYCR